MNEPASKHDLESLRAELLRSIDGVQRTVESGFQGTRQDLIDLRTKVQGHGERIAIVEADVRRAHARIGDGDSNTLRVLDAVQKIEHQVIVLRERGSRAAMFGTVGGAAMVGAIYTVKFLLTGAL